LADRSLRPHSCPHQVAEAVERAVIELWERAGEGTWARGVGAVQPVTDYHVLEVLRDERNDHGTVLVAATATETAW
jgi:hypothetical protein